MPSRDWVGVITFRRRTKREQLERFEGLLRESQGHNLAWTVVYVPYTLDIGKWEKQLGRSQLVKSGWWMGGRTGVRPFHQKSTCLTQLTLGPHVVQIWPRNPQRFEGGGRTEAAEEEHPDLRDHLIFRYRARGDRPVSERI